MRYKVLITSLILMSTIAYPRVFAMQSGYVSESSISTGHVHHEHPKLKKIALIAGVGALTGGIGGVVLGTGMIHGAALGAGSHVAFHEAHEKWKEHKATEGTNHHHHRLRELRHKIFNG